jgi:aspartokinase
VSRIPILVQKFDGTSVSTAERRQQVVGHVGRAIADGSSTHRSGLFP